MSSRDIIIGPAAGLNERALFPWAATARKHHDGRIVLLVDDPTAYSMLAARYGVEVRNMTSYVRDPRDPVSIWKHRWEELRGFLTRETQQDAQALFADVTDVVFQRDPFADLNLASHLSVASEGRNFRRCAWNRERMQKYYRAKLGAMLDHITLCAGVVGGPIWLLETFAAEVYKALTGQPGDADQSAFNIIARRFEEDSNLIVRPYHDTAWTIHCAQMHPGSKWFAAGPRSEALPVTLAGPAPVSVMTDNGKPFAIVHHWDDVPALNSFGDIT